MGVAWLKDTECVAGFNAKKLHARNARPGAKRGREGGLDRGKAVLQFRAKEENYVLHTYVRRADLAC